MGKIYSFDIGTRLRMDIQANLTGYSTVEYKIRKPDGTTLTKTCTVEDIANGIIYYDTVLNDLDQIGSYSIQAQIVFSDGDQFESETQFFLVHDSFN